MNTSRLLADLEAAGIRVVLKLRVSAVQRPDPETLENLKMHKKAIIAHLSQANVVPAVPALPQPLKCLLRAASAGSLQCELPGVRDVNRHTMAWGCSYLTGNRDEALERLWEVYAAWIATPSE